MVTPGTTPPQSVSGANPVNWPVQVVTAAEVTVPTLAHDLLERIRAAPTPTSRKVSTLRPVQVSYENDQKRLFHVGQFSDSEFDGLYDTCLPWDDAYPFGYGYYQFVNDTLDFIQHQHYGIVVRLDGVPFTAPAFSHLLKTFADAIEDVDPLRSRNESLVESDFNIPEDSVYYPPNVGPDEPRFTEFWGLPPFCQPEKWTMADYRLLMIISVGGSPLRRLHDFAAYRTISMIEPQGYRPTVDVSEDWRIVNNRSPTRCSRRVRRKKARLNREQHLYDDTSAARAAWREDAIYPIEPQGMFSDVLTGDLCKELNKLNSTFDKETVLKVISTINASSIRMQSSADKICKVTADVVNKVTDGGVHRPLELEVAAACQSIDKVHSSVEKICGALDWPSQIMSWIGDNSNELGLLACLCTVVYGIYHNKSGTSSWPIVYAATALAVIFANRCNAKHEWIGRLTQFLVRNLGRGPEIEAQGFTDLIPEIMTFAVVFAIPLLDCKAAEAKVKDFCKKQSQIPRTTSALKDMIDFGIKVIDEVIKWIASFAGVTPFSLAEFLRPEYKRFALFIEGAQELLNDCRKVHADQEKMDLWPMQVNRLKEQKTQANDLRVEIARDRNLSAFSHQIETIVHQTSAWIALFEESMPRGSGTRMEPATILFSGKPGIGKTWLVESLQDLMIPVLHGVDPNSDEAISLMEDYRQERVRYVYTKPNGKFWSMYKGQPMLFLDEVLQRSQGPVVEGDYNEVMDFLEMVNCRPYPLNMNENTDKGKVFFMCRAIIGTTNLDAPVSHIKGINEPQAYVRRWDVFVDVTLRPEFDDGTGKLDSDKLMGLIDEQPHLQYTFPHLRFTVYKNLAKHEVASVPGIYDGKPLASVEFDTIMQLYVQHYHRKANSYRRKMKPREGSVHPALLALARRQCSSTIVPQGACELCKEARDMPWQYPQLMVDQFARRVFQGMDNDFMVQMHVKPMLKHRFWAGFLNGGFNPFGGAACETNCLCHILDEFVEDANGCKKSAYCFQEGVYELGRQCGIRSMRATRGELYDNVTSFFRERWSDIVRAAAGFCVGYLGAMMIGKTLNHFFGKSENDTYKRVEGPIIPQHADLNAQEIGQAIIKRNVMLMEYENAHGVVTEIGNVLFLVDRVALMPQHYLHHLVHECKSDDQKGMIILSRLGLRRHVQKLSFPVEDLFANMDLFCKPYGPDTDLVCAYFPKSKCITFPDIRRYLVDDAKTKSGKALAYRVRGNEGELVQFECCWEEYGDNETYPDTFSEEPRRYVLNRHFVYNCENAPGDCGMPVMLINTTTRCSKLFGFHVAGRGKSTSYAVRLSTSLYDACINHLEGYGLFLIRGQGPTTDPTQLFKIGEELSFNDLPAVPKHREIEGKLNLGLLESVPNVSKSAICRSPIYKKIGFDPQTRPARLHPFMKDGKLVDPAVEATKKYSIPIRPLGPLMTRCARAYSARIINMLVQNPTVVGRRKLTLLESIAGIEGVDGINGIPRSTSSGYPWNLIIESELKGKQVFFGVDGEYTLDTPEAKMLLDIVLKCEAAAMRGIRMAVVFRDFHKDERRQVEKILAGKTRKISGAPVHWVILVRMYFGAYCDWYMSNRIRNGSAVGINPYSPEWTRAVMHLGPKRRIIAGDFSNYDGHLPYELMKMFLDHVNSWYGLDQIKANQVREVLFEDVCNSRHILDGVVYEWIGSNSSGNPLTTILNTHCNNILLMYATVKICLKDRPTLDVNGLLSNMDDLVRFLCYGDDNLVAVNIDHEFGSLLTQESYTLAFQEIGLTYTDETKSASFEDRRIGDVTFLKRGFQKNFVSMKHRDRYAAPLALETILESIQWTKHKDVSLEDWKRNVQNMILELSLHKRDIFDEWVPRIVKACQECSDPFTPVWTDYVECQAEIAEYTTEQMW